MKTILFCLSLLSFSFCQAQDYILENENSILEFETSLDKYAAVAVDKNEEYIVVRFGTCDSVQLTYPTALDEASWKALDFSTHVYTRGRLEYKMDLNYLYFDIEDQRYVVYETYFEDTKKLTFGVKIIDLKTMVSKNYPAKPNTVIGTLDPLRKIKKLKKGNLLFD